MKDYFEAYLFHLEFDTASDGVQGGQGELCIRFNRWYSDSNKPSLLDSSRKCFRIPFTQLGDLNSSLITLSIPYRRRMLYGVSSTRDWLKELG